MEQFPNVRIKKPEDCEVLEKQTTQISIRDNNIYNEDEHIVACVRSSGEFKGKAIYLHGGFEWVIGTDNEECQIAIPLKR